jgi:hypothetical protein
MAGQINDLTGRTFGLLHVERFTRVIETRAYFHCTCRCVETCHDCHGKGCEIEMRGAHLTSGMRYTSCGCLRTDPGIKITAAKRIPKKKRAERARTAALATVKAKAKAHAR